VPDIVAQCRVEMGVGQHALRGHGIEKQIEGMAAAVERIFGVGIDAVVIDRLDHRPFDHVGRARHQDQQHRDVPDGLMGVLDPVIDMDRARGRDHPDEQADPH